VVEGHGPQARQPFDSFETDFDNPRGRCLRIGKDRHRRDTDGRHLLRSQELRAARIGFGRPRAVMRASVDLDRQPG
jgi:hypothetical protein